MKKHKARNPLQCSCAPEPALPAPAVHEFSFSCACEACIVESTARMRRMQARLKATQVAWVRNLRRGR